ncbi:hypothetical protein AN912_09395 [Mycobacteroides immunogenum]|uniref:Uncharacterized protein n=1 Tax=Mycobacteroides immunogenum TaxID=83262 RepID=A0ABR5LUF6_9MYCO|nr:hypothetical protein AN912_09395 [Mycobacteroides immunogenum]
MPRQCLGSLLAAKVNSLDGLDVVTASVQLLALWGRPLIAVTTLRGDEPTTPPPPVAAAALTASSKSASTRAFL